METLKVKDIEIPALGYGTWQLDGEECVQGVKKALEVGYRHIDTAQIYRNEEFVGAALSASGTGRDKIFLTTKIWMDNFAPKKFADSLDESLDKLQTDYVDLLLLHWPSKEHDLETTLMELMKTQQAGKTKHIGVSNYTLDLLEKAYKITDGKIVTNQVEHHPFINQTPVLNWLKTHNMFLTAYTPMARGDIINNPTIDIIAQKHSKTPGQVTLRWQLQKGVVAIPKAASKKHIINNFDIFDFELDDHDMDEINALQKTGKRYIDPAFAPDWDTARAA